MGPKRTDEFRKDAVRIALTSGLTRKQVADDLSVRMNRSNGQCRLLLAVPNAAGCPIHSRPSAQSP